MDTRANQVEIEELWRRALSDYREEGLEGRLKDRWPYDPNVTERITHDYPPTFQPGYLGSRYFESQRRIVLLGQNPGEGSNPPSQRLNSAYLAKLEEFTRGETTLSDLNDLIESHMLEWDVFGDKGIFREDGAGKVSLLPQDLRPSICEIGYVNYFPFKIARRYRSPRRARFLKHVWRTYVLRMLQLLKPTVTIRYPSSDSVHPDLESLPGPPKVLRAWHPSDYNVRTRPWELVDSWESVAEHLRNPST